MSLFHSPKHESISLLLLLLLFCNFVTFIGKVLYFSSLPTFLSLPIKRNAWSAFQLRSMQLNQQEWFIKYAHTSYGKNIGPLMWLLPEDLETICFSFPAPCFLMPLFLSSSPLPLSLCCMIKIFDHYL